MGRHGTGRSRVCPEAIHLPRACRIRPEVPAEGGAFRGAGKKDALLGDGSDSDGGIYGGIEAGRGIAASFLRPLGPHLRWGGTIRAVQGFAQRASPWRRGNSLAPSLSNPAWGPRGRRRLSWGGQKKMRSLGTVPIPTEAFMAVWKLDGEQRVRRFPRAAPAPALSGPGTRRIGKAPKVTASHFRGFLLRWDKRRCAETRPCSAASFLEDSL